MSSADDLIMTDLISQDILDGLEARGLFNLTAKDANDKLGIAESSNARGQAFMDPNTILGTLLDTSKRSALALGPLQAYLELLKEAVQLKIVREQIAHEDNVQASRQAHEVAMEKLQYTNQTNLQSAKYGFESGLITDRKDAELAILLKRKEYQDEEWEEYKTIVSAAYTNYWSRVDTVLAMDWEDYQIATALTPSGTTTSPTVAQAKASVVEPPILPPAPRGY
ncbi:MAG: hypothetical protein KKD77_20680 [Gammaproteobacteria bacterium]|nr:hypothetical protein [Gammaproteobacteria bacterium]